MSHPPVGDDNQRPNPVGAGDRDDSSKLTCHPGDVFQRDSFPSCPSEQTLDHHAALIAINETGGNALASGLNDLEINSSSTENMEKDCQVEKSTTGIDEPRSGADHSAEVGEFLTEEDRVFARERKTVSQYLLDNVAEFRELSDIRLKVSNFPNHPVGRRVR